MALNQAYNPVPYFLRISPGSFPFFTMKRRGPFDFKKKLKVSLMWGSLRGVSGGDCRIEVAVFKKFI